ncbi:MAG: hypothetical protein GX495_09315 [Chloroflexi bacterium]|nr:hypothetical protein [Chloroflexota bacterium]
MSIAMIYRYQYGGQVYEVNLERHAGGYRAHIDGQTYELEILGEQPGQIYLNFAGRPVSIEWAVDGTQRWFSMEGCSYILEKPAAGGAARRAETGGEQSLRAPMPAQVRTVFVQAGEQVEKGDDLLLLEAMKMEIRLRAPYTGRIRRVLAAEGDTVERDQILVEIES